MASRTIRVVLVVLPLVLAASLTPAHAGSSHPYFDDAGTLVWYRSLADAQRAARAEGKLIFIEYGRSRCGSCKVLCNRILPDPRIRARLSAVAVGLASECDRPEAAVQQLFDSHLRNAHMLPFAAFITPDGRWVTGFAGSGRAESFLAHLAVAERARPQPVRTPRVVQAPRPAPVRPRPEVVREEPAPPRPTLGPCAPPVAPRPAPKPTPAPPPAPAPEPAPTPPSPPSVELAEADRAGRTSVSRAGPLEVPPAELHGSPDAQVVEYPPARTAMAHDPCRAPGCRDGQGPDGLPAPRVTDLRQPAGAVPTPRQPVSRTASDARRAETASTADARWADDRLDFAADAVAAGRYEEGLAAIEEVLDRMPGEAAFVDAARGLDAIKRLLQQRFLDPDGQVAKAARRMAYEDMWGTRWAKLFK